MDVVNARSIALPGIIAAAILCGALACGPARADSSADAYAFGGIGLPQDYAQLILGEGSQSVSLSDDGFQGWVSTNAFNFTGPDPVNTSYIAGVYAGSTHNNFFVFDLAGVDRPVTSAKLDLYAGTISTELNYSLYGATQAITELIDGVSPDLTLYDELGTGPKYGSFTVSSGNSLHSLILTLNSAAVSEINAAILGRKTQIVIAGSAGAVPELSTWIMMLAGFAGLSLAASRRAARGRRTVSAG